MKRNWWIWSLAIGVGLTAILIFRVVSQRYEIEYSKVQHRFDALDERLRLQPMDPASPPSAHYQMLAEDIELLLQGDVHPRNRAVFTYFGGWSRLKSGEAKINEAFGSGEGPADPTPDRYMQGWRTLESIAAEKSLDVPNPADDGNYDRFRELTGGRLLARGVGDIQRPFGIHTENRNGKKVVTAANAEALAAIGVGYVDSAEKRNAWYDVVQDDELTQAQRDFIGNRHALHQILDQANLRLAQRFMEMDRPEYAWQFYSILFKDRELGGGKFRLQSLYGRVLEARKRQLRELAIFSGEQSTLRYQEAQQDYAAEFARYSQELNTATVDVSQMIQRLETLYKKVSHDRSILKSNRQRLEDFDPGLFRETLRPFFKNEQELEDMVSGKSALIESQLKELDFQFKEHLDAIEHALDTIREFVEHFKTDPQGAAEASKHLHEALGVDRTGDRDSIGVVSLVRRANTEMMNAEERARYFEALWGVALIDLRSLRTRMASYLLSYESAHASVSTGLAQAWLDLDTVREGVIKLFEKDLENLRHRTQSRSAPPYAMYTRLEFLDALIAGISQLGLTGKEGINSNERTMFRGWALELQDIRKRILRAGLDIANLKYQEMLQALSLLTGDDRPIVDVQAAQKYSMEFRQEMVRVRRAIDNGDPHSTFRAPSLDAPMYRALKRHIELETQYRRKKAEALAEFRKFEHVNDDAIRPRARFGIASIHVDHFMYEFDWKWRTGFERDTARPEIRNGVFAFIEGLPEGFEGVPGMSAIEGYWLAPDKAVDRYLLGADSRRDLVDEVNAYLQELRIITPGQDDHLYVGVRMRSAQFRELRPITRHGGDRDIRPTNATIDAWYLGDLPGALEEFSLPVLLEKGTVSNDVLVRNEFVPLGIEFSRVMDKLNRWMTEVDDTDEAALMHLFEALAPRAMKDGNLSEGGIADFYSQYLDAIEERAPGLMNLPDQKFRFIFRLGELARARANILLVRSNVANQDERALARRAQAAAADFFKRAASDLFKYTLDFPHAPGNAARQLQVGDGFFASGDYIFAITAYRKYFNAHRYSDRRSERAQLYYVSNRIGEAYMAMGLLEGQALRTAKASGDQVKVEREMSAAQLTMDSAIQAFEWTVQSARQLLNEPGNGDRARNLLPPVGALDAFINLARAKYELGRQRMGSSGGPEGGEALLKESIDLLRRDIIRGELFPTPPVGFSDSIYWRDAQYYIGAAELELARRARAKPTGEHDDAELAGHLHNAEIAFEAVIGPWAAPIDRELYMRALGKGSSFADADGEASHRLGEFTDDIYYLTIYNAAEVDWLRAIHNPYEASDAAVADLDSARGRLSLLRDKLKDIQGSRRNEGKWAAFSFPELLKQTRFLLSDVTYVHARVLRDRLDRGDAEDIATIREQFRAAADAYDDARKHHADTYLAAWAYAQTLNCYRALARWDAQAGAQARHMLEASSAFLKSLDDSAFRLAPEHMRRSDFEDFFRWYDLLDS